MYTVYTHRIRLVYNAICDGSINSFAYYMTPCVYSNNYIEYEIFFPAPSSCFLLVKEISIRIIKRLLKISKLVKRCLILLIIGRENVDTSCNFQYFSLVILMFLAEFMLGTLAFVFREHLARSLKEELLYGIEKHYNITREPGTLSAMWDHIHTEVCLII